MERSTDYFSFIPIINMERILTKKFAEVEELLQRFMQEATILTSADKDGVIKALMNQKLIEFKCWSEERYPSIVSIPISKVTSTKSTASKSPRLTAAVPSFMAPTISSIASATITPRSCSNSRSKSTERSISSERTISNNRKRLSNDASTPSFMAPKASMLPKRMSTSRSHSTERAPPPIEKTITETSESSGGDSPNNDRVNTVYFSSKVTTSTSMPLPQ